MELETLQYDIKIAVIDGSKKIYSFSTTFDGLKYEGKHAFPHLNGTISKMRKFVATAARETKSTEDQIMIIFGETFASDTITVVMEREPMTDIQLLKHRLAKIEERHREESAKCCIL